jgi:hypothetical protein
MQWMLDSNYSQHNHASIANVNEQCGDILQLSYRINHTVSLDAGQSLHPDNDELNFEWFHYRDVVQEMSRAVTKSVVSKHVTIMREQCHTTGESDHAHHFHIGR